MKNHIMLLLCVIVLSGCGARGGSAPPGSTITIGSFDSVTNANTTKQRDSQTVQVIIKSGGNGVNNANIDISFDYTSPPVKTVTNPDGSTTRTFPDPASVVTLCGGAQILNATVQAKTDDWGVYYLCIEYDNGGGLAYAGNVKVLSGDQSVSTALTVQ
ncbi:MAG: hypothetical protein ACHQ0Y_02695 [Thermodesulfovibrionales bacterium]